MATNCHMETAVNKLCLKEMPLISSLRMQWSRLFRKPELCTAFSNVVQSRRNEVESRVQGVQMQRGAAVAPELAGEDEEAAGAVGWTRGRCRKPRRRWVKPAAAAEPRAHLMQALGFVYARDSSISGCMHSWDSYEN